MNGKITYDTISKFFREKYGCETQIKEMENNITGEIYDVIFKEGADVALFSIKDNRHVWLDSKVEEVDDDLIFGDINGAYVEYEMNDPVFDESMLSLKYKYKDIDIFEINEFENELYPFSFKLYVPLLVHRNEPGEPWNYLNELEEENGAFYTDEISEAVKKSMHSMGIGGLAYDIHGPMRDKIASVTADVTEQNGQLFGVIEFISSQKLTQQETALLEFWTYEEMTREWSAQFENQPIPVEDGELYVSFYNDMYDYTIETEEEFFTQPHDQTMDLV